MPNNIGHLGKIVRILSFFIVILLTASVHASEELLIDQFFGKSGIADKNSAYTGEMLKHFLNKPTLGENLPDGVNIQHRLLNSTQGSADYAVLLSKDGQSQDWYIYLRRDLGNWQISAVRNLALPGLFFMGLQELADKPKRSKRLAKAVSSIRI
jgi:hypothetical protein